MQSLKMGKAKLQREKSDQWLSGEGEQRSLTAQKNFLG